VSEEKWFYVKPKNIDTISFAQAYQPGKDEDDVLRILGIKREQVLIIKEVEFINGEFKPIIRKKVNDNQLVLF